MHLRNKTSTQQQRKGIQYNRHVVKDGLDWTGKTRTESVFYKWRTEFVKHGLEWENAD